MKFVLLTQVGDRSGIGYYCGCTVVLLRLEHRFLTSNKLLNNESYLKPSREPTPPTDEQHFNPADMPEDTAEVVFDTTTFLEFMADFLHCGSLMVITAWLPTLDHHKLGALSQSANTVAMIRRSW